MSHAEQVHKKLVCQTCFYCHPRFGRHGTMHYLCKLTDKRVSPRMVACQYHHRLWR